MIVGGHNFPRSPWKTGSCINGCGAWLGPWRSGGDAWGPCPKAKDPTYVRPAAEMEAEQNALREGPIPSDWLPQYPLRPGDPPEKEREDWTKALGEASHDLVRIRTQRDELCKVIGQLLVWERRGQDLGWRDRLSAIFARNKEVLETARERAGQLHQRERQRFHPESGRCEDPECPY